MNLVSAVRQAESKRKQAQTQRYGSDELTPAGTDSRAGRFENFVSFDEFQDRQASRAVFWNIWLVEDKGVQVALFVEIEKVLAPIFPSDELKGLAAAYIDAHLAAKGTVPVGSLRVPALNLRFDFHSL